MALQKIIHLREKDSIIGTEEIEYSSTFLIEPLEIGQGITLANAIRRTLLSDLTGYAITGIRINNLKHEFDNSIGVREDTLEIISNLKEIIFKGPIFVKNDKLPKKFLGTLQIKGPKVVTAGLLNIEVINFAEKNFTADIKEFKNLTSQFLNINENIESEFHNYNNTLEILNPSLYICSITNNHTFDLEIDIERGKGYKLYESNILEEAQNKITFTKHNSLSVDSIYMPIKNVNYKIKMINDAKGNIKESISISIVTNGSITPLRALKEALKDLLDLLFPLFIDPEFLNLYNEFYSKEFDLKNKK